MRAASVRGYADVLQELLTVPGAAEVSEQPAIIACQCGQMHVLSVFFEAQTRAPVRIPSVQALVHAIAKFEAHRQLWLHALTTVVGFVEQEADETSREVSIVRQQLLLAAVAWGIEGRTSILFDRDWTVRYHSEAANSPQKCNAW